jgi:hypothetical protein
MWEDTNIQTIADVFLKSGVCWVEELLEEFFCVQKIEASNPMGYSHGIVTEKAT